MDGAYYRSICKDINGLSVFKGTLMMVAGGDNDHYTLLYFHIKELFAVLGVEMILDKIMVSKSTKTASKRPC
jgi:hypothetical protein